MNDEEIYDKGFEEGQKDAIQCEDFWLREAWIEGYIHVASQFEFSQPVNLREMALKAYPKTLKEKKE